jgi:hypothetical protein
MLEGLVMLKNSQHQSDLAQHTASAILGCRPGCQSVLDIAGIGGLDSTCDTGPDGVPLAH